MNFSDRIISLRKKERLVSRGACRTSRRYKAICFKMGECTVTAGFEQNNSDERIIFCYNRLSVKGRRAGFGSDKRRKAFVSYS